MEFKKTLLFEVTDNGIGIDPLVAEQLFQPFSQGDVSITRKYGGTGLGLTISKQLIEMMDGQIAVESVKNFGSRFFFDITLKQSTASAIYTPLIVNGEMVAGKPEKFEGKVLIAEDNKVNQQVICTMMEMLGCNFKLVENGFQALEALKQEIFDLVLMDGQMPEMDGYEASRQIRLGEAGEHNKTIPIMAVTANAMQEDIQRCYDVGMNDFVSKPIDFENFSYKIRKWMLRGNNVIDKRAIDNLKEMAATGNRNLIKDLVLLFTQEASSSMSKLRDHAQNDDFVNVARTAHHLKSSCANLGIYRMTELAEKLELQKNKGDREQALALIESLEREYGRAIAELKKMIWPSSINLT